MKKDHPIFQLNKYLFRKEPRLVLEFSRYIYVSYGVTLSRETFHIKASELINSWLEDQIELLSEGQELAFHSRVRLSEDDSNIYHIPMIDFINTKSAEKINSKILPVNQMLNSDLTLYESGNSYHGYYFLLLSEHNWYKFLGKILLCNPPSRFNEEIVDSRWVGHSLEHGFSALRWSKKTEKYKIIPKLSERNGNQEKYSDQLIFDLT
ncbi:MAG TPA: hypothetical protein VF599_00555 [Pyrinomonadaceae bacterium]|jgi:hypothetical protein